MTPLNFIILSLAVFRVSSLIANEDGPFDIFTRLRVRAGVKYDTTGNPYGTNNLSYGLLCQWCNSLWIGIFITPFYWLNPDFLFWICLPFALSALTVIISEKNNG